MKWADVCEKVIAYYEDHEDEFDETIRGADYDDFDGWYSMDYLQEKFEHLCPLGIMQLALNSYAANSFDTDDDYFREDDDGLLESTCDPEPPIDCLNYDLVERLYHDRGYIEFPTYVERLFEAYAEDSYTDDEDEEDELG